VVCQHSGRFMSIQTGSVVSVSDIDFVQCGAIQSGGVFSVSQSQLALRRTRLAMNSARLDGGAVYANESVLDLVDVEFDKNTVGLGGGGAISAVKSRVTVATSAMAMTLGQQPGGDTFSVGSSFRNGQAPRGSAVLLQSCQGLAHNIAGKSSTTTTPVSQTAFAFAATFFDPGGLHVHNNGCIYVADTKHNCVRFIDTSSALITDPAKRSVSFLSGVSMRKGFADGASTVAKFREPQGVFARDDMLFVADTGNHLIRQVRLVDGFVTTVAGNTRTQVKRR
jgi:hypothetical protein